jgi:hypothetical protein
MANPLRQSNRVELLAGDPQRFEAKEASVSHKPVACQGNSPENHKSQL